MNALFAVKDVFSGFTKKAGFDPSHPEKLTAAQKQQIRRYYNLKTEYTEGQPVYLAKFSELPKEIKTAKNGKDAAMRAAQMYAGRKRSKFIFVKYDGENIPRFAVRNNAPVIVNDAIGYAKEVFELSKDALATDPVGTIKSLEPLTEGAQFYRILVGRHDFYNGKTLDVVARKVVQLQNKYDSGNHAWENWLVGVSAYYSDKVPAQAIINYERSVKDTFKARVKKERAALMRARKQNKKK